MKLQTSCCSLLLLLASAGKGQIVISQIYGGGGNLGATLRNDYVELFNRGRAAASVDGWTLQHASATGTQWERTYLNGSIQPGQYFLIQLYRGNSGTVSLPSPDVSAGMAISAETAKLALVTSNGLLAGNRPTGTSIVDYVGYGSTASAELRPAPPLSNLTALFRRDGGCMDTDNNSADFSTGTPQPRNSRSPLNRCFAESTPQISSNGIVNAASFLAGAIAPGEVVTLFGSGLGPETLVSLQLSSDGRFVTKTLAGTRVLFDGIAAPLLYVTSGQVSAIVPYGIAGQASVTVQAEVNGRASNGVSIPVVLGVPAIFTLDSSGAGPAAALNQDGQLNHGDSPATPGSIVVLYATGGGMTDPGAQDGEVQRAVGRQVMPIALRIGGQTAEILYAGPVPGMVSGVMQINVRIPEGLASGAHSLEIRSGSQPGSARATVAVGGQ